MKYGITYSLILSTIVLIAISCKTTKDLNKNNIDYNENWKRVEKLNEEGFVQQAEKALQEIIDLADSNGDHIVATRAVLSLVQMNSLDQEEFMNEKIPFLQSSLQKNTDPSSEALVNYTLALVYYNYWNSNSSQFPAKLLGETVGNLPYKEWSSEMFADTIQSLFKSALSSEDIKTIPVDSISAFFYEDKIREKYMLWDFLMLENIRINKSPLFTNLYQNNGDCNFCKKIGNEFLNTRVRMSKNSSADSKTAVLYQKLQLKYKKHNQDRLALISEIDRIKYFIRNGQDQLLAIKQISTENKQSLFQYVVDYAVATAILDASNNNENSKAENSSLKKDAYALLSKISAANEDNIYSHNAKAQIGQIQSPSLSAEMEMTYLPKAPLLMKIDYRNLSELYYRIYPLTIEDYKRNQRNNGDQYRGKLIIRQAKIDLPNPLHEYIEQSLEVGIDELPAGYYGIVLSTSEKLSNDEKEAVFHSSFLVSNLFINDTYSEENNSITLECIDRATGEKVDGAKFELFRRQYNNKKRISEFIRIAEGVGNPEYVVSENFEQQVFPLVKHNGQFFFQLNGLSYNRYKQQAQRKAELLTDRSVYRPGQEVFFKGILYSSDENRYPSILKNQEINVRFFDAFNQEISAQKLSSDDFGGFDGSFEIPANTQNGNHRFAIEIGNENIRIDKYVRVEEYKRPKFKVEFQELSEKYSLDEKVSLKVDVESYTGLKIENAKVSYKIYRSSWMPYFYRSYYSSFPRGNQQRQLIDSGNAITDKNGELAISFVASTGNTNPQHRRSFSYEIELDVTDSTGETQSASKSIPISEQSLFIKLDPLKASSSSYKLTTVNSEDKFISSSLQIKILKSNEKDYKVKRYWPFPDVFEESQQEMQSEFPDYAMYSEDNKYSEIVYDKELTITDSLILNLRQLVGSGDFKILISNPEANDFTKEIVINDFEKKQFGLSDLMHFELNQASYQPGDNLTIDIGTVEPSLKVQVLKIRANKVMSSEWIDINKAQRYFQRIDANDLGGFTIVFKAFYKNRAFTFSNRIDVPWEKQKLTIKAKSIRYVTEPGTPEKWSFIVTDHKGNPVKSSVLSSMYDASLDKFGPNKWNFELFPTYSDNYYFHKYSYGNQRLYTRNYSWNRLGLEYAPFPSYPNFKYVPSSYLGNSDMITRDISFSASPMMKSESRIQGRLAGATDEMEADAIPEAMIENETKKNTEAEKVRTNFNETVFFYSNLKTDQDGFFHVDFTMNDAISTWKLQNFAITQDLKFAFSQEEIISRKELMIQANQLRFVRKGDHLKLAAKLINLSDHDQIATAKLTILNPKTDQVIPFEAFQSEHLNIKLGSGETQEVFWNLNVPGDFTRLKMIYSVATDSHEDAEQHVIPVMPDEIYLIDSRTVQIKAEASKKLDLSDLLSETKRTTNITIETTGSPVWFAMRALPFLITQNHENSEAIFNRMYSNSLAKKILEDNPLIDAYYKNWKAKEQLKSQLTKNSSLKQIDLSETPWLSDAQTEEEIMLQMSVLFDSKTLDREIKQAMSKLTNLQLSNGGLPWFIGGRDNYYMSQYVLSGMLRMEKLGILYNDAGLRDFRDRLYKYCQDRALEQYAKYKKDKMQSVPQDLITHLLIYDQLSDVGTDADLYLNMIKKLKSELEENWFSYQINTQISIAQIFIKENLGLAEKIVQSLLERSFYKEQLGRFWNSNENQIFSSWAIERQASMIELFNDIGNRIQEIEEMKYWLIVNKRTNNWQSSIATSAAIYGLTLGSESSFKAGKPIITMLDGKVLQSSQQEVGVNYEKFTFPEEKETSTFKEVEFKNENKNIAWANIHHQFFQSYEDIQRTSNEYFDLKKEIYRVGDQDQLENIADLNLALGDRIRVRLIVETDREMEFVHLSDDRPSGCEPTDATSGYQYSRNMAYYKSIKDLGTHFFIDHLFRGKYIIEYDMFINNLGEFKSGIAKIQNMYAPEFNDYSKNISIKAAEAVEN